MKACKAGSLEELKAAVMHNKKFDTLVLDSQVSFEMGQVLESIFQDKVVFDGLLEESVLSLDTCSKG
jgi:hypothetical protein